MLAYSLPYIFFLTCLKNAILYCEIPFSSFPIRPSLSPERDVYSVAEQLVAFSAADKNVTNGRVSLHSQKPRRGSSCANGQLTPLGRIRTHSAATCLNTIWAWPISFILNCDIAGTEWRLNVSPQALCGESGVSSPLMEMRHFVAVKLRQCLLLLDVAFWMDGRNGFQQAAKEHHWGRSQQCWSEKYCSE